MAIITEESTFISSDTKSAIHYYLWIPEKQKPRGIVQLVHGMQEYIGRYRDFAEELAKQGYLVGGHDHLGHGLSAAEERDLGFFSPSGGDRLLVQDVKRLNDLLHHRFPGLPLTLLGHSMGSFVARDYLTRFGETADAFICSGTGGPDPKIVFGIKSAERSIRRRGARNLDDRLRRMSTGRYNARIQNPRTPHDWLTRDEEIVDRYETDPFTSFPFTASAYRDLFSLYRRINTQKSIDLIPESLPVFLFSGSEDPVGQYGEGVRRVYRMMLRAGIRQVTMKLYEGYRHECLNEIGRETVYQDVLRFLEKISPQE